MFLPENMVYLCEFNILYTIGVWSEAALSILALGVSAGAPPEEAKGLAFLTLVPPDEGGGWTATTASGTSTLLSSTTAAG